MENQAAALLLKSSDLFGKLSAEQFEQLLRIGHQRPIAKGEILYLQGEPGTTMYLIVAGEVRISAQDAQGQELYLKTFHSGDLMGEIALLDGGTRTATATVTKEGAAFCIERPEFLRLLEEHPSISIELLKLMCQRVRWTSEFLEDSTFLPTDSRIAKQLLAVAQRAGIDTADGREVALSQADLARYLNLTRQVVNQFLQDLQAEGLVQLGRNRIVIRDQAALLGRASPQEGDGA